MRKPIVAGNWKMNKTPSEAINFVNQIKKTVISTPNINIIIAPPFTCLFSLKNILQTSQIKLSSQDISKNDNGANAYY